MTGAQLDIEGEIAVLDPQFHISELERQVATLRRQRDREIAGRQYAEEQLARMGMAA